MEVSADLVYDQPNELVLQLLERFFALLVLLNDAFYSKYSLQQHQRCNLSGPASQGNHDHLTSMEGQGERMSYVGMLLRTADRIRFLFNRSTDSEPYEDKMRKLTDKLQPAYLQGMAAIHFLTASACQRWNEPDSQTLLHLLHLVHALKEARRTCMCNHPPFKLHQYYKEDKTQCTLEVINDLLEQCSECARSEHVRHFKELLGDHLKTSCWVGCDKCESMLVNTIVYANMLYTTNFRMLASLRLSLDYVIDLSNSEDPLQGQHLQLKLARNLFKSGFTEIDRKGQYLQKGSYNLYYLLSMEYEVMFISGRRERKDDFNCLLMEGFLKRKEKRPFFIQCEQQLLQSDPRRKCCEAQIRKFLHKWKPGDMYYPQALRTATASIILEQGPCGTCKKHHVPAIKQHLEQHKMPLDFVAMLEFKEGSIFLQRLTAAEDGRPLHLEQGLQPFNKHNVCMFNKCKHVQCKRRRCRYSKPSNILAVHNRRLIRL